jgi:hypothetical protein
MKIFTRIRMIKNLPLISLLMFCAFFSVNIALAFDNSKYTQTEKVGFAFYKLGEIKPDFETWVKLSKTYQKVAGPVNRHKILQKEQARLQRGFYSYFPEFGNIEIKTPVTIKGMPKYLLDEMTAEDEFFVNVTTRFGNQDLYFPFQVADQWVTLLPNNTKDFSRIVVTEEIYKLLSGEGVFTDKAHPKTGFLKIVLQPSKVDTSSPSVLDGVQTWLMQGEIGSMSLWYKKNRTDNLLWEHTAPWYVSEKEHELKHLYTND